MNNIRPIEDIKAELEDYLPELLDELDAIKLGEHDFYPSMNVFGIPKLLEEDYGLSRQSAKYVFDTWKERF